MSNKIALIKYDTNRGKWIALTDDGLMLCQSQSKSRVKALIEEGVCNKAKKLGYTQVKEDPSSNIGSLTITTEHHPIIETVVPTPKISFTASEKFDFIAEYTQMSIGKKLTGFLISGGSGLGKTYEVLQQIKLANLKNTDDFLKSAEIYDKENGDDTEKMEYLSTVGDYIYTKGYSSPKGLFKNLYWNRKKLVIYDDCDSILQDVVASNILKAVLDSSEKRVVTWDVDKRKNDNVPRSFTFEGGAVFITNMSQDKLDEAVKTRCIRVDVELTPDERIKRIQEKINSLEPNVPINLKWEVYEFLKEHLSLCPTVNFRTFKYICEIRLSNSPNWRKLAQYTIMTT